MWEKTMGKVDCYVRFAYNAYSAVIQGWIRHCMKGPGNWWLNGSESHLVAIPYMFSPFPHTFPHVPPTVSPVCLGIYHVFLGISPCFLFEVLRGHLQLKLLLCHSDRNQEKISLVLKKQNIYLSGFPTEGSYTKLYSFRWRFINDTYDKTLSVRRFAK